MLHDTYNQTELAEKCGLTINQAKIVISSDGPSRHGCEVGAQALRKALQTRTEKAPSCHYVADQSSSNDSNRLKVALPEQTGPRAGLSVLAPPR